MLDPPPAKKSLGQHFLVDRSYCRRILRLAAIGDGDPVLEIGPGTGLLTERLLEAGARVVAIEIDPDMVNHLTDSLAGRYPSRLTLVQADVLAVDWGAVPVPIPSKVVGNLPYNIASRIIQKMMPIKHRFQSLTLMLQKELAQRLLASPGGGDYGYFSVLGQYHFRAVAGFDVPAGAFRPPPKVRSHVLRLEPTETPGEISSWRPLQRLLRAAFAQRRKTLFNNLRAAGVPAPALEGFLRECGIPARARAEEVPPAGFLCLARMLQSAV